MLLEFKWCEFFKHPFIFSVLLFLICLQTLTFSDVLSTNNKSFESTNENNLTNSVNKNFINISDDNNNNTSINQNQTIMMNKK